MALSGGQKFCLFFLLVSALALLAGSAAPYWGKYDQTILTVTAKLRLGLWFFCSGDSCDTYPWDNLEAKDFDAYFYVVHAAGGLASLCALILVLVSLAKLCGRPKTVTSAAVLAMLAAALGITAAVVFYLEKEKSLQTLTVDDWDWAFPLFASASGLLALLSLALAATGCKAAGSAIGPV